MVMKTRCLHSTGRPIYLATAIRKAAVAFSGGTFLAGMSTLKKTGSPEKGLDETMVRAEGLPEALLGLEQSRFRGGSMAEQACVDLELDVLIGSPHHAEAETFPCVRHYAKARTCPLGSRNDPQR